MKRLGATCELAQPGIHETNGVIERTNRTVIEGSRTFLFQSGLPLKYWPLAVQAFAQAYNFGHIQKDSGKTPYQLRLKEDNGAIRLPFGARIKYRPNSERERSKVERLGSQLREGIFVVHSDALHERRRN